MRTSIHQESKQYVKEQAQHLGGRVTRQDLNNAAKKVSRVLEQIEATKQQFKK